MNSGGHLLTSLLAVWMICIPAACCPAWLLLLLHNPIYCLISWISSNSTKCLPFYNTRPSMNAAILGNSVPAVSSLSLSISPVATWKGKKIIRHSEYRWLYCPVPCRVQHTYAHDWSDWSSSGLWTLIFTLNLNDNMINIRLWSLCKSIV